MLKTLIIAAAALALTGCAGIPGTGGTNFDVNAFVNNPACAHDDELQGVTGAAGIPASLQFKVARHCPAAAPVAVGTVVGASPTP
jgi:hypothetical protein